MIYFSIIFCSYSRKFSIVRNQNSPQNLKSTATYKTYVDFVELFLEKVHYDIYYPKNVYKTYDDFKKSDDFNQIKPDLDFPSDMEIEKIQQEESNKTMVASIALAEVCDKITDGEIFNAFILLSNFLKHPLNNLLSTAALAVSFFNHKLSKIKKSNSEEYIYNKSQLPKITYIAFEGFYSEITIDTLLSFSDNVQIIIIYDANTGGPNILHSRYGVVPDNDYRVNSLSNPSSAYDKILYLPLECDPEKKSIFGEDFMILFDDMVLRSIRKFKPDLVVMSHSFTFTKNNKTPFYIEETQLSNIVYNICLTCNFKLIIFPFKLHDEALKHYGHEEKSVERIQYIKQRFCEDYDRKYLKISFVNCVETLSGIINAKMIVII